MNRRGFLACIAALTATSVISPTVQASLNALAENGGEVVHAWPEGMMRELMGYDMASDSVFVRYDILFGPGTGSRLDAPGDQQMHVDFRWPTREESLVNIHEQRAVARKVLENSLKEKGATFADLRQMELPPGMSHSARI